ncbi:MAG: DNA polymerase III subunit gamma/tau [Candidatus Moraniibacteriota bacterium]|nr:MAG: DNA polymerase III subunit gamma/tau [Candidatus Moranbacteria bacterium]
MSTFYRKYRPDRFADVIGQDTAVAVLTQSLIRDKIAHAYLLTGPRGTGKTTLARLFAQAMNCSARKKNSPEPCGKCSHCIAVQDHQAIDIVEIDAASHTGVDNIRELRDTIATSPVLGSHKVYIIDEAHMLSIGAWNALLKTLEEPPAHVVFILATTNIAKVPETILSRSLRLDLKRFPLEQLVNKLQKIAKAEKIDIDDESLLMIARSATGGMRDAEVLFTQIATLEESPIRVDRTALLLGATTTASIVTLLQAIAEYNLTQGLSLVRVLGEQGANMTRFVGNLLQYLRQALYASVDPKSTQSLALDFTKGEQAELLALAQALGSDRIVECMERFQEAENLMKYSPLPELPLEIALVKLMRDKNSPHGPSQSIEEKPQARPLSQPTPSPAAPKQASRVVEEKKIQTTQEAPGARAAASLDLSHIRREWRAIIAHAKHLNASLGVALSTTELVIQENAPVTLEVRYPFHKERLEKPENRLTIDTAFATILGFPVPWVVRVAERKEAEAVASPLLSQALEALGGKLVTDNN